MLVVWSPETILPAESEKKYRSVTSRSKPLPLGSLKDVKASIDLTVVIPAYNETSRLPSMLESTMDHLQSLPKRTFEILIIDDGSSDGTSDFALKLAGKYSGSDIRVVTLRKNLGKGGAVRHGMLHGRGKRLLMVDADGASRFEDLELLWKAMDEISPEDQAAVAVGSRAHLVKTDAVVKVGPTALVVRLRRSNLRSVSALFLTKHFNVRPPHDPAHRRCGPHPRHPMRFQAFHSSGCTTDIPLSTSPHLDIRR